MAQCETTCFPPSNGLAGKSLCPRHTPQLMGPQVTPAHLVLGQMGTLRPRDRKYCRWAPPEAAAGLPLLFAQARDGSKRSVLSHASPLGLTRGTALPP